MSNLLVSNEPLVRLFLWSFCGFESTNASLTQKIEMVCLLVLLLLLAISGQLMNPIGAVNKQIQQVQEFFQAPGVNATDILRARGYIAKNYHFVTDDGYVLSITRGLNPFINKGKAGLWNKRPILFVHGFSTDSTSFLANSFGAKASDMSHLNLANMSLDEARELLSKDDTSHSLPMLALNLGHEVWLLHRRGTELSRTRSERLEWERPETPHEKLIKARKYVEKLDRQVESNEDPIEEIEETNNIIDTKQPSTKDRKPLIGTKLTDIERITIDPRDERNKNLVDKIITRFKEAKKHSKLKPALAAASSAIFNYFKLFDDIKLTFDQRFWNYSMDEQAAYDIPNAIEAIQLVSGHDKVIMLGDSSGGGIVLMSLILNPQLSDKLAKVVAWAPAFVMGHSDSATGFGWIIPLFQSYDGPFPLPFLTHPMEATMQVFCALEVMQRTVCELLENMGRGTSKGQSPIRPEYYGNIGVSVSSKEAAQVLQLAKKGSPQMYDFGSPEKNYQAYGQFETPIYDPGLITFGQLSIWASTTDALVSPDDINLLVKSLKVPHKLFVIDQPEIAFNHGSLSFHVDINKLAVIPTLKDMEDSNI